MQLASAGQLKVVSYNIAMGMLMKSKWSQKRVIHKFLSNKKLKMSHILGLQEICLNHPEQLELFANIFKKQFGIAYIHTGNQDPQAHASSCQKGQAIISAYPIVNSGRLQLPRVGSFRAAIWADIMLPSLGKTRVYNLHLSNRDGKNYAPIEGRWTQAKVVYDHALARLEIDPSMPVIILGDFNSLGHLYDPWVKEKTIVEFSQEFSSNHKRFSPTMVLPYMPDWIFYKNLTLHKSGISHFISSDHLPIYTQFTL